MGEDIGLLSGLCWIHELNICLIDFELDSKIMVDKLSSPKKNIIQKIDTC